VEHPTFAPGFTRRVLAELGIPRTRVVIELGERDPALDAARLAKLVPAYGEQGFAIAMDDFGAGHASIAALLAIRPRFLKLDRTLVHGAGTDSLRAALIESLVDLGASTDMTIIAEGIETEADVAALRERGVRYAQGYLLGRPATLPAARAA
jgi:EAL domain-containing protein (putative c-di-GMP-specific phosphodiesterase class I)